MAKNKREKLISFIDRKVFNPVLKTKPKKKFSEKESEELEDLKRKTKNEKEQFHKEFRTAAEVKKNYLKNLHSPSARKVYKKLDHMNLPTMENLKEEFKELCEKLEV